MIARRTGFSGTLRVVWDTSKPNGQPRMDTTRAREYFGFEARTSFEEGLRGMIEWYGKNRGEWLGG